jgi:hypothetical protein
MSDKAVLAALTAAAIGLGGVTFPSTGQADGMFNAMNPFNWFFGDRDDRYYRYGYDRWDGPYGWAPPYGAAHTAPRVVVVLAEDNEPQREPAPPR